MFQIDFQGAPAGILKVFSYLYESSKFSLIMEDKSKYNWQYCSVGGEVRTRAMSSMTSLRLISISAASV